MRKIAFLSLLLVAFLAQAAAPREVQWSVLVPKGWNPIELLKKASPQALDDSPESMRALREIWDNAPTNPEIIGANVKIPGYVVPLDSSAAGMKEFLLVPYFGACIHTPPPPANQIVHVLVDKPAKLRAMDVVWVSGVIKATRTDSAMGASGYRIEAAGLEPFVPKSKDGK